MVFDGLAPVIERLDGELHRHAKADLRVKVLTALPGVGEFTALVMLAEIGDISRFPSACKLASWEGLTPRFERCQGAVSVRGGPGPEPAPHGCRVDAADHRRDPGEPRYTGRQVRNRQRTDFDLADPANSTLGHRQVQRWNLPEAG
jgi:hypothetical protein